MDTGGNGATLRIAPTVDQIRTARLVACAAARRAGLGPDQVEDVRLAVSEACTRAMARQAAAGADTMLTLVFADYGGGFTLEVFDAGGADPGPGPVPDEGTPVSELPGSGGPIDLTAVVLRALAPDATVEGPVVRMRWEPASADASA